MSTIGYPSNFGTGLQVGSPVSFPEERKKRVPISSARQAHVEDGGLFSDLIVSGEKSRKRNPWATFGSLTLQSLVLMAVVVIPLFHTDVLPNRETVSMLYLQAPAAAAAPTSVRTPVPRRNYSPTSSAPIAPVTKTEEAPPPAGGVVGGIPGGVGVVPGGVLSGVLASTPTVPALAKTPVPAPKRVRLASRVVEANLIRDVTPTYPAEAGRERIEGTVILQAVIGKDGTVQDVQVVSGLPLLAQAAIDAVKQWRYKPYLLNGEPVEVDSRITINFTMSRA
jgi:protein TonB